MSGRFESLPEAVREVIELSGVGPQLAALRDLSSQPASLAFLRGLLKFWWDSTNTFHFPWGEMMVTLYDFSMITGFPFGGEPVVLENMKGSDERLHDLVGDHELSTDEVDQQCTPEQLAQIYIAHDLSVTILSDREERFAIGLLICHSELEQVGNLSWAEVSYARMLTAMGKVTQVMDSAAATEVPRISISWHDYILEDIWLMERLRIVDQPQNLEANGVRLFPGRRILYKHKNEEEWMTFFYHGVPNIRSVIPWWNISTMVENSSNCSYIRLLGLSSTTYIFPCRVMRQYGMKQLIPPLDYDAFKDVNFKAERIPRWIEY
ncbi:protein MAINTENANCE OF MERISTEMS-like [Chenopodium quinoa]|uniref:protein MAINTENANCE OF MERISTEMS-like n=1 Tax=Chenopodium quinoa TaxID=63459 RepID=UPI000B76D443|nr:protein MAINTENANCE OF MERISTEMS-like [Chenopodium quinoa]